MNKFSTLLILISLTISTALFSQAPSLRINEVSQGATGNQEYIELVVIGTPSTCSTPQCLDLRGWILDDNNGYFSGGVLSGSGVAAGAIRFSNNVLWQCITPGTIILIYNDNDYSTTVIPPNDLSMTDGNCRLVIPISSTLFERHETQPGTSTSTYPTTGWVSGGRWSVIGMANGADSFQIYAAGSTTVPVHGVSWGSGTTASGNNNTNNIIYFSGSAAGKVFSCVNTTNADFSLQANWVSNPVAAGQTAGVANSTQNAALINTMNSNCTIASSISVTVTPTNVSCNANCNGTASLAISGGQAPYQIVWSNAGTGTQISNLCAGNYSVTVTDAGGCDNTQNFTIGTDAGFTLTTSGNVAICEGESTTISVSGAATYSWNNNLGAGNSHQVSPTTTTTYSVTGTANGCSATENITVTVNPSPQVNAGPDQNICTGSTLVLSATGADTYSWDQGVINNVGFIPADGQYTYTVTGTSNGCSATDQVNVTVGNIVVDAGTDMAICLGQSVVLEATGATSYVWSDGKVNGTPFIPGLGVFTYTVTGTSGNCIATDQITIVVTSCGWELEMPNVFTPDGDNINDLFVPVKQNNITVKQFEIFNRWGNIMYSSSLPTIVWDGKSQSGDEASEGVYFYQLKFEDGSLKEQQKQGFIHLLRK